MMPQESSCADRVRDRRCCSRRDPICAHPRVAMTASGTCDILAEDPIGGLQLSVRAYVEVTPSASRLTNSLRDIGYDFPTAVADLVDNCIAADATRIEVDLEFEGADSIVVISDDGVGMTTN